MNEINGALPTQLTDFSGKEKAKNTMGKDDFMKLLMAQLQNQDPLKPMDHHEMAAQLSQFGSLEQLTNIGAGIQSLRTGMGDEAKLQAVGMIGKRVQAASNDIDLVEGQAAMLRLNPDKDHVPVKASVYDGAGKLVRELSLAGRKDAQAPIAWDGKSQEGTQLPPGKYTFRVQGVDSKGQSKELSAELSGRVAGVEVDGAAPILVVETASGKQRLELHKVKQVLTAEGAEAQAPAQPQKVAMAAPAPVIPMVTDETEGPLPMRNSFDPTGFGR